MGSLGNKTRKLADGEFLLSIAKIAKSVQQIGISALLFINNLILSINSGNYSTYLLDFYSYCHQSGRENWMAKKKKSL